VSALVIDTSSWIAYFRQGSGDAIIEPALEQGTVYLPPVVASELLSGRMAERARGELEEFLLTLPLCQADIAHWLRVGRLRNSLAAKGLSLSTPDAHVAQCATRPGRGPAFGRRNLPPGGSSHQAVAAQGVSPERAEPSRCPELAAVPRHPVSPSLWIQPRVKHSDDHDRVGVDAKEQTIRESAKWRAPGTPVKHLVRLGMLSDEPSRRRGCIEERSASPRRFSLYHPQAATQVGLGGRLYDDGPHREERIRAIASSHVEPVAPSHPGHRVDDQFLLLGRGQRYHARLRAKTVPKLFNKVQDAHPWSGDRGQLRAAT